MRVLWITSSFFPRVGDVPLLVEETIGRLADLCEVGLITKRGQWYPSDQPIAHFVVPEDPWDATRWPGAGAALRRLVGNFSPDIVHFGSAPSALCRSVLSGSIPAVATVHGDDFVNVDDAESEFEDEDEDGHGDRHGHGHGHGDRDGHWDGEGEGDEDLTGRIVESLDLCNCVLPVSSGAESLVRRWGVSAPMQVFVPGCDLEFYRPWPPLGLQARAAWNIPQAIPLILTVGPLIRRNGHLNVLEAIRMLPYPVHWVIAGEGPCLYELAAAVEKAHLSDRVSMVGDASDDDVLGLYNAADLFVFTPDEGRSQGRLSCGGFGLALLEAAACGKPVIASALAGCRDAVIDGGTGILVPPGAPDQLAAAMTRVLNDADLANALGTGGLELVRNSGGWARLARQYMHKYEEVLCANIPMR
jgi:glycosyltransferase involved in cell wall biosynthesis